MALLHDIYIIIITRAINQINDNKLRRGNYQGSKRMHDNNDDDELIHDANNSAKQNQQYFFNVNAKLGWPQAYTKRRPPSFK